jgi:hypothetical protein
VLTRGDLCHGGIQIRVGGFQTHVRLKVASWADFAPYSAQPRLRAARLDCLDAWTGVRLGP